MGDPLEKLMIKSFRHKGLKRFHERDDRSLVRPDLRKQVQSVLSLLDAADSPEGMRVAKHKLHKLKGDRKNYWSVTVNRNWRIIFRFENGNAYDVEMIDYH